MKWLPFVSAGVFLCGAECSMAFIIYDGDESRNFIRVWECFSCQCATDSYRHSGFQVRVAVSGWPINDDRAREGGLCQSYWRL